jgi:hypothetical protein
MPRSVRAGRDFTVATLQRWGAAERCEDIAIVVSELLTNAPPGSAGHSLDARSGSACRSLGVACCARSPTEAEGSGAERAGTFAETGRGLHGIGALADTWGYTPPSHTGKVVCALFSFNVLFQPSPQCIARAWTSLPPPGSRTIRVAEAVADTAGGLGGRPGGLSPGPMAPGRA